MNRQPWCLFHTRCSSVKQDNKRYFILYLHSPAQPTLDLIYPVRSAVAGWTQGRAYQTVTKAVVESIGSDGHLSLGSSCALVTVRISNG